jgi:hypothetical protein
LEPLIKDDLKTQDDAFYFIEGLMNVAATFSVGAFEFRDEREISDFLKRIVDNSSTEAVRIGGLFDEFMAEYNKKKKR